MSSQLSTELHVVLGSGPLGRAVARELVQQGKQVRVVNRSGQAELPTGVEVVKADLYDSAQVKAMTQGATTVYQCAQPMHYYEWETQFQPLIDSILAGLTGSNSKLIVGDNLYMYGDTDGKPIHEDLPYAATTKKGRIRAKVDEAIREAHRQGRVQTAIGRSSDYYGPEALFAGNLFFKGPLQGGPINAFLTLDASHTLTYLPDFGRGLVTLGTHEEALGQEWIVPSAPARTVREYGALVFDQLDQPARFNVLDLPTISALGQKDPTFYELLEMAYEFEKPFIVDSSKFERTFGVAPTSLETGFAQSLEWFRDFYGAK